MFWIFCNLVLVICIQTQKCDLVNIEHTQKPETDTCSFAFMVVFSHWFAIVPWHHVFVLFWFFLLIFFGHPLSAYSSAYLFVWYYMYAGSSPTLILPQRSVWHGIQLLQSIYHGRMSVVVGFMLPRLCMWLFVRTLPCSLALIHQCSRKKPVENFILWDTVSDLIKRFHCASLWTPSLTRKKLGTCVFIMIVVFVTPLA